MLQSMTGFAVRQGEGEDHCWTWEARSVNGKGLDLRLRLPDGIAGLEAAVRTAVTARFTRGNITVSLKLDRLAGAGPALNRDGLAAALANLKAIEAAADEAGMVLSDCTAAEILMLKGVTDTTGLSEADGEALKAALLADLTALLDDLATMRAAEGSALADILTTQIDRIESLTGDASRATEARGPVQAETFRTALQRVMENTAADPDRVAQELAVLAVKSDVTEEIDRLGAHVTAARELMAEEAPVGRRFDFLAQEFNREANTLASKSGYAPLTRVALDLKATIDQLREQVQNVE